MTLKSMLAVSAAVLLPGCVTVQPQGGAVPACAIAMAASPGPGGQGVVTALLTRSAAMTLLSRTQAQVGAPIDGAYINNQRVSLRTPDGGSATVLIPYDMQVSVGDRIAYQGSYRSPGLPCSYVPNLATRKF